MLNTKKIFKVILLVLIFSAFLSLMCTTVNAATKKYTLNITASSHGKVSPSGKLVVKKNANQTIFFYPNTGYEVDKVIVNGISYSKARKNITLYGIDCNTKVKVVFKKSASSKATNYTLNVSAGANGMISPSGIITVKKGENRQFKITPNSGYQTKSIKMNNEAVKVSGDIVSINNISKNYIISVEFEKKVIEQPKYYTVNVSAGANGRIQPSGILKVKENDTVSFVVTPNSGYKIKRVMIDNESHNTSKFRVVQVDRDFTVMAEFERIVTTPSPENGNYSSGADIQKFLSLASQAAKYAVNNFRYKSGGTGKDGTIDCIGYVEAVLKEYLGTQDKLSGSNIEKWYTEAAKLAGKASGTPASWMKDNFEVVFVDGNERHLSEVHDANWIINNLEPGDILVYSHAKKSNLRHHIEILAQLGKTVKKNGYVEMGKYTTGFDSANAVKAFKAGKPWVYDYSTTDYNGGFGAVTAVLRLKK